MNITGTLIKNFYHCKRQAYLYYYGLNFSNDLVRIGEIMHKEKEPKEHVFEKIKVDDIKGNFLIEYKKTSANFEGTRMQVLHYLDYFHQHRLMLKAKVIDLTYRKEYIIEYNKDTKQELMQSKQGITNMLQGLVPKRKARRKECKGCSFLEYCWSQ